MADSGKQGEVPMNIKKKTSARGYGKIDWGRNFGLGIIALLVLMAVFAPVISPYDPTSKDLSSRLIEPFTKGHVFGTDNLGRDILSQIIYGARVSVFIGLAGTLFGLVVGSTLGLLAGFYGGWIDTIIMRLGDVQLAFPFTLLAIALMGVLGPGIQNIIIVAIITGWVKYARVVRAEVMAAKELEYVQAGYSLGLPDGRLLLRHILPNVIAPALVVASLETGRIILMEASLTFLGLGVPSSIPTWGSMLTEGRTYMLTEPWLTIFPGIAITITVLSVNMVGDWLRNHFDPKLGN